MPTIDYRELLRKYNKVVLDQAFTDYVPRRPSAQNEMREEEIVALIQVSDEAYVDSTS